LEFPSPWQTTLSICCARGRENVIRFLWRRTLPDPDDDFVLELASAGGCQFIVTHNIRDFVGAERFGIALVTPGEFLRTIGEVL
jgi:predicted nucleic acid-binding protein